MAFLLSSKNKRTMYLLGSEGQSLFALHILFIIYSISSVLSKFAGQFEFLSPQFFLYYLIVLILLCLYALGWQQALKRMPLTQAFANKAITVVWGIIWGAFFFGETISLGKCIAALLIIFGILLFSHSEKRVNEKMDD